MNPKLQELLEDKIKIYETIINGIKEIDYSTLSNFYSEFEMIEKIDIKIKEDPQMTTERVMKIRL
jgi:hypothetical protein